MRSIERTTQRCIVCDRVVAVEKLNSPDPEAPELFRVPHGGWCALVNGDGGVKLIVVCNDLCGQELLRE